MGGPCLRLDSPSMLRYGIDHSYTDLCPWAIGSGLGKDAAIILGSDNWPLHCMITIAVGYPHA